LLKVANGSQNAGQGLLADQQHLLGIEIEVLVRNDISEAHGSLPVDVRKAGREQTGLKLV
jgi:hypothetical protein